MKKYLQIILALGVLGILIFIKQIKNVNSSSNSTAGNLSPLNSNGQNSTNQSTNYKNGTYTGSIQDAYYGSLQVQATIQSGKISDITFLQYPSDNRTSQYINSQALPILKQETLVAQSANINGVSGASATSPAFIASLTDALNQAK